MRCLYFYAWLVSINMFSTFIHFVEDDSIFLCLIDIPLYMYKYYTHAHIFFIHLFDYGHLGRFHTLAIINQTTINVRVQLFLQHTNLIFLDVHFIMQLLYDGVVEFFFNFWEFSQHFSIMVALIYTHTNSLQVFPFLHIFTNTYYPFYFNDSHSNKNGLM